MRNPGGPIGNQNDQMHPDDRRNLILFILIAVVIYFAYDHFLMQPKLAAMRAAQVEAQSNVAINPDSAAAETQTIRSREDVVADGARVKIDNGSVFGTIPAKGGRIDDLQLKTYFKTLGGTGHVDTVWTMRGNDVLSKDTPVTMEWANGQGLPFTRTISVDDKYMVTVKQSVTNNGAAKVTLYPYAYVAGIGIPEGFSKQTIAHEGPIGYLGDKLHEVKYKDLDEKGALEFAAAKGWIGITEKYWLTTLVPEQGEMVKYRFVATPAADGKSRYQADMRGAGREIAPGASAESVSRLFAGAKEVRVLDRYEREYAIPHFDLAVDFGLYYFLTKPFFYLLSFLWHVTGNFGVAIVIFTVLLRGAMFPLNNTSYRSFAKLKKIAPQMTELRDQYKDDKQKLQQEMVALYTREKVNPAAGCVPILLQIPIFFALYKVLSVTIEMRHAPFFGWIHDLSAMDPTTIFNLFGLIPWDPPLFMMIGAWPCLMLLAMLVQRSMNPPPQDPVQAKMIQLMPYFMTFIMAQFASGLVIYWTVSNVLSVVQQYIIMRSMGVEVKFFHRPEVEK
ncbi:MAG: membrane protein insertase YidC, partial [Micavibrio aeruginosavorus]|nr:membrane protein insertase YidC [Micavibrio aeruginosavorus]